MFVLVTGSAPVFDVFISNLIFAIFIISLCVFSSLFHTWNKFIFLMLHSCNLITSSGAWYMWKLESGPVILRVTAEVNKPTGTSPWQKTRCLFKNRVRVNWESAQLRMRTATAEDLSAVSNTRIRPLTSSQPSQESNTLLCPPWATACMCIYPTHVHILK